MSNDQNKETEKTYTFTYRNEIKNTPIPPTSGMEKDSNDNSNQPNNSNGRNDTNG